MDGLICCSWSVFKGEFGVAAGSWPGRRLFAERRLSNMLTGETSLGQTSGGYVYNKSSTR